MKLIPLFEMTGSGTEKSYTEALAGGERVGFVIGEGVVTGERLSGTFRRANAPHHRADDVNVEDTHGVITTRDGALVIYTMRGIAVRIEDGRDERQIFAAMTFRTSDPRLAWLARVFAVAEARYDGRGGPSAYRVYECGAGG